LKATDKIAKIVVVFVEKKWIMDEIAEGVDHFLAGFYFEKRQEEFNLII